MGTDRLTNFYSGGVGTYGTSGISGFVLFEVCYGEVAFAVEFDEFRDCSVLLDKDELEFSI